MDINIADLFCGIGGIAEAVHLWRQPTASDNTVAAEHRQRITPKIGTAIDIDQSVAHLYQRHHGIIPQCSTIESLQAVSLKPTDSSRAAEKLDMWWMSPPCQPYTRRGLQRGDKDSRSLALANLIRLIPSERPRWIGLENVPAFEGSQHHQRLRQTLTKTGYQFREYLICPTAMGIPMRRKRFYLLATQNGKPLADFSCRLQQQPLAKFVDNDTWNDPTLHVPADLLQHYQPAMNILDIHDSTAISACFTSAYGKSHIKSGSYLRCHNRHLVRRFSPNEIANLMGFRENFFSSSELGQRSQYRLIGNSLAVHVVCVLLSMLLLND